MILSMAKFDFTSVDGTRVRGWRNREEGNRDGIPVVISNGLGTPPEAWPTLIRPDSGMRVCTWYYRGTGGGDRPADRSRVRIDDHVGDLLALLDHEEIERAVIPCWSMGVSVGFEFARRHPERVAGLMAVAGSARRDVPRDVRHHAAAARHPPRHGRGRSARDARHRTVLEPARARGAAQPGHGERHQPHGVRAARGQGGATAARP